MSSKDDKPAARAAQAEGGVGSRCNAHVKQLRCGVSSS